MNAGFKIKRRDDLIPNCVELKFRITGTWNNQPYVQVIRDIAGVVSGTVYEGVGLTGALCPVSTFISAPATYLSSGVMTALQNLSRDFAAVATTIDMEGNSNKLARCQIGTMAVNLADPSTGGGASYPFWKKLFPEFNSLASAPSLFAAATCVVDNPNNQNTSQPNDGTTVNLSTFQYLLTDGQIAPWMLAGNAAGGAGAQVVQATINAKFVVAETTVVSSTNLNLKHAPYKEKTARVTLVSIPGGLYATQDGFTPGEVIPYGLAGYIFNIAQIPQYEGTFTIQETEITDLCPIGNNLNITGGRAEWSTMAASIQSVQYDLLAGKTTLTFGPAGHLGPKDLVERLRVNRGPRALYSIGGNLTNDPTQQSGTQLGSSVAQRGPTTGTENHDLVQMPTNLSDLAAHTYSYGSPGITMQTAGTQPNWGNISGLSAPGVPTIFMANGSGGTLPACIRISLADLAGTNKQAYFQPINVCVNVAGTPTQMVMWVLATAPESS